MNRFLGGAAIFAALIAIWGSGAAQQVAAWIGGGGQDQPIAQTNDGANGIPPAGERSEQERVADDETVQQAGRLARRQGDADSATDMIPDAVISDGNNDEDIGEDLGEDIAEEAETPAPSPPQPAVPALW